MITTVNKPLSECVKILRATEHWEPYFSEKQDLAPQIEEVLKNGLSEDICMLEQMRDSGLFDDPYLLI